MIDFEMLRRAGEAYERVGALDDAVRCYVDSTAFEQAKPLLLRLGRFEELARVYADGEDVEAAAWLYVHELDSPETARLLLAELLPLPSDYSDDGWTDAVLDSDIAWISRFRDDLKRNLAGLVIHAVSAAAGHYLWLLEQAIERCDPMAFKNGADTLSEFLYWLDDELYELHHEFGSLDNELAIPAEALALRMEARADAEDYLDQEDEQVSRLMRELVATRCDIAEGVDHRVALPVLGRVQDFLAAGGPDLPQYLEEWSVALAELTRRYDQAALVFAASVRGRSPGAAQRWRAWSKRVLGVEISVDERHETVVAR